MYLQDIRAGSQQRNMLAGTAVYGIVLTVVIGSYRGIFGREEEKAVYRDACFADLIAGFAR